MANRSKQTKMGGLSGKLLLLVMGFVLVGEILIFAPSLSRFRQTYLMQRVETAHLAILPLAEGAEMNVWLEDRLLSHAGAQSIELYLEADNRLIAQLGRMPPVTARYNLDDPSSAELLFDAFATLYWQGERLIEVRAPSPKEQGAVIEIALAEGPMWREMVDYAWRIAIISAVLSIIVAALLFFALRTIAIGPLQRLALQMAAFRRRPLDARGDLRPEPRRDEIGELERQFADLRVSVRAALNQRGRLAALGMGVNKINHDLRNMLSAALLISDRLENSNDPMVRETAPKLIQSLERAVRLCGDTLSYSANLRDSAKPSAFDLRELVDQAGEVALGGVTSVRWTNAVAPGQQWVADRDQLFRALMNLGRNSVQAIAGKVGGEVVIEGGVDQGALRLTIADNGPGVPESRRDGLFDPFAGSDRPGGSGLGLAITREVMRANGGDARLLSSSDQGAVFELTMPCQPDVGLNAAA